MSTTDTTPPTPISSASFDSTAVFEPTISPSTVLITGTATNANNIANIEVYDNGTPIGGVGQLNKSSITWTVTDDLQPGRHFFRAVVTELSGASYNIYSRYQLVTGIQNQPYVFQELDENSLNVVTRVSSYDGAGNLVSQTAVAVNDGAAAPLTVAFDPTTSFVGTTEAMMTGTTSAYGSASSIEIFDGPASSVIDPTTGAVKTTASPLGYATLGVDGTWSFDAHVSPGHHQFTAVATSLSGLTAAAQSSFDLVTGIVGAPYVFQEIDHNAKGAVAATISYAADGSTVSRSTNGGSTVNGGFSTGQVLTSSYNDVMTGDGTGSTTFVFKRGFGQDEITNFNVLNATTNPTGLEHDVISLPDTSFRNFAQVMRHTTTALDGDAVIHLNSHDSIKIDGVTKADLITHPNVVRFHS